MRTRPVLHSIITSATLLLAGAAQAGAVQDPFFGEALYHAHQGRYFEALARLDTEIAQHYGVDEPWLDAFHQHIDVAEFSVGDFELSYRMHDRAGRAVKAVLGADVSDPVRNDAAYRLARIQFQKGQPGEALRALDGIRGAVPEGIRDDIGFLRANIYMATDRALEAVELLQELQPSEDLKGFAAFNLGIALLRGGETGEAIQQLDRAGREKGGDSGAIAIRDKANLVLGTMLFEASEFSLAQRSLDRVRLSGPFSNQALLGAGWASASADGFERALVPWSVLAERDATDLAVQEALLALPYAYSKLSVHGRAAVLYEQAAKTFGEELTKIDASIESVREGAFLSALSRQEIRQDSDWVVRLRDLPEAPETFYLLSLMASHDFQTALQNYLDLEDLRRKLTAWDAGLESFQGLIESRRRYYEPLLPGIDRRFRQLDAQIRLRLEQRKHVEQRLQQMLTHPRPDHLTTTDEREVAAALDRLAPALDGASGSRREALLLRWKRLHGVLTWDLAMRYHERLTDVHADLRDLAADVDALTAQYDAYVRARQAATHSYDGYGQTITKLRGRVRTARKHLGSLIAQQGEVLEKVSIRELAERRERLEEYQNQARFAFADSYDRAVKSQASAQ